MLEQTDLTGAGFTQAVAAGALTLVVVWLLWMAQRIMMDKIGRWALTWGRALETLAKLEEAGLWEVSGEAVEAAWAPIKLLVLLAFLTALALAVCYTVGATAITVLSAALL